MKPEPEIDAIIGLPETSLFMRAILKMAMRHNATDAANDARVAAEILERRADRLQRESANDNSSW